MKKQKMKMRGVNMLCYEMHMACRMIPAALKTVDTAEQRTRVRGNTSERLSGIISTLLEVKIITRASANRCHAVLNWCMWRCPEAVEDLRAVYPDVWGKSKR